MSLSLSERQGDFGLQIADCGSAFNRKSAIENQQSKIKNRKHG